MRVKLLTILALAVIVSALGFAQSPAPDNHSALPEYRFGLGFGLGSTPVLHFDGPTPDCGLSSCPTDQNACLSCIDYVRGYCYGVAGWLGDWALEACVEVNSMLCAGMCVRDDTDVRRWVQPVRKSPMWGGWAPVLGADSNP